MNYLTSRKFSGREIRIYPDKIKVDFGDVIYSGHKLGLDDSLLPDIIDMRFLNDKTKCRLFKYDENIWLERSTKNLLPGLLESWESIIKSLESQNGKFRKVTIVIV